MGQNDIWKIVGLIGHFWMESVKMVIGLKRRAIFALFMKIKTHPQCWHLKKATMVWLRVLAVIPKKLT